MATQAPSPATLPLLYNDLQPLNSGQHGNLKLKRDFTVPGVGQTHAIPVTVEIRSALGEVVPIATPLVDIILSKNAFAAGTVRQKNAVAGIATFSVVIPTAANGYHIVAEAPVAGGYGRAESNLFDVIP